MDEESEPLKCEVTEDLPFLRRKEETMAYSEEQLFRSREQVFSIEHEYHKLLTGLATGSLVLSIAFVKDIAPDPVWKGALCAAWIMLFCSVFFSVFRAHFLLLFFSQRQTLYEKDINPYCLQEAMKVEPHYLQTQLLAQTFRLLQPASLLGGLLLLAIFAIRNA
jgi:hypothetical protein